MALDDDAVVIAKEGHIFIAPPGTAKPVGAPTSPWVEVGHTGADTPLTLKRDGGDTTTKGTWQKAALRSDVAPVTYSWEFPLLQQDELCMSLYFGGGAVDPADTGYFVVPTTPTSQEHAMYILIHDGDADWDRWAPKVGIIGSDDESDSTDDFTSMPVSATILTPDAEDLAGLFKVKIAS